jgi:hypothetical protein
MTLILADILQKFATLFKFQLVSNIFSYHFTWRYPSSVCRATLGKQISALFKRKLQQTIPVMLGGEKNIAAETED